jgi:hypothetical protein
MQNKQCATINSECYIGTLTKFNTDIQKVHPDLQQAFLQHENVRPHTSAQRLHIHHFSFTVLDHVSYSLDLDPTDFHLFPKLKEHLRGHHLHEQDAWFYSTARETT